VQASMTSDRIAAWARLFAWFDFLRQCMTVRLSLRLADYTAEANSNLESWAKRKVTKGVDIDVYRLLTSAVADQLAKLVYSYGEDNRNTLRTLPEDELAAVRTSLVVASRDVDELRGLQCWLGPQGKTAFNLTFRGLFSVPEMIAWCDFSNTYVAKAPPLPANWIQTVSTAKYPAGNSQDDLDIKIKLAAGFVPWQIVGFVKPMGVSGVSVRGFQVQYRNPQSGESYNGRLQGAVDFNSKDKDMPLTLALNGEAITKIGLTLPNPQNKFLSVTFHTSGGQAWTLGGSSRMYQYVLGNGLNTAFVNFCGDFRGQGGALQNLAYWCVGI